MPQRSSSLHELAVHAAPHAVGVPVVHGGTGCGKQTDPFSQSLSALQRRIAIRFAPHPGPIGWGVHSEPTAQSLPLRHLCAGTALFFLQLGSIAPALPPSPLAPAPPPDEPPEPLVVPAVPALPPRPADPDAPALAPLPPVVPPLPPEPPEPPCAEPAVPEFPALPLAPEDPPVPAPPAIAWLSFGVELLLEQPVTQGAQAQSTKNMQREARGR